VSTCTAWWPASSTAPGACASATWSRSLGRGTAPSRWSIVGRYVLPPAIWGILERTTPGVGGEIQLTDALKALAASPAGLVGVPVRGVRHDAGDRLGYLRANLAYALKRPELRDGVLALMRELSGPR
jgi:UTP--glucose-1-phosphate uridylyltransferase